MSEARDGSNRPITMRDVLFGGNSYVRENRPVSPDMDRISEIVLGMKAITEEYGGKPEFETKWREHIARFVDFDALAWQALQVAFSLYSVSNGRDLTMIRQSSMNEHFVRSIQAFYDGFLLGAEFQAAGGHRG